MKLGVAVDRRRTNKSMESLQMNVQRLKEYMSRVVVLPKNIRSKPAELKSYSQIKGSIIGLPKSKAPEAPRAVTKAEKEFNAFQKLNELKEQLKPKKKKEAEKGTEGTVTMEE